ncbi:hypothetical protein GAYE_SCF25G4518 [Galdieria yellowstonensis]|uniref:Uncharacterized protein n=1 Tax=Galdieria yellowstonensis TaxID=3028027 RepID=A0AAV9IGM9_9RHOD|nr:hypothetical protein GAYE_SCF25G4518 [Galdieria yellowstonensis]
MNAQNSAVLNHRFCPLSSDYKSLEAAALKDVIIYALKTGDIELCIDIRENIMLIGSLNLLIVDEHNAFWQKLGNDPNKWPSFFAFYAHPVSYSTRYCKFVIASSPLHEFKRPSGYESSIQYVEPLSLEEFAVWENLSEYPPKLKDKKNEVIDLTGLVPRIIGMLVNLANASGDVSFEQVAYSLKADISNAMKRRHFEYVDSLNDSKKADFAKMLYELFLGRETPTITICEDSYRDRGLLIAFEDRSLQFYNSLRVIFFLKLKEARMKGVSGGEYFRELFLGLCLRFRPDIQTCSRASSRTIHFQSNAWFRFDGKYFDRRLSSITTSCWIRFIRNYARLDYAYVDMTDGRWMFSFELLFEKSGGIVQLASLLNAFFDESFEVSPVYDARKKIMDFKVTDSRGISCRDRISILYATPLTRSEVKANSAPYFVEFLTFDNVPDRMKPFIDVGQKVRGRRRSRSRSPVKRIKFEET